MEIVIITGQSLIQPKLTKLIIHNDKLTHHILDNSNFSKPLKHDNWHKLYNR